MLLSNPHSKLELIAIKTLITIAKKLPMILGIFL